MSVRLPISINKSTSLIANQHLYLYKHNCVLGGLVLNEHSETKYDRMTLCQNTHGQNTHTSKNGKVVKIPTVDFSGYSKYPQ